MDNDVRLAPEERREGEAVRNARHRIALLAETVGTSHPDYATGLNQLALLMIMQGDPEAAEPLLREALDIRQASLGDMHPDYATNLSSLGGLLWARGELDEAEPLLRKAADIRLQTLGGSHPKTIVSQNSLEQLLQARRALQEMAPALAEESVPEPVAVSDIPETTESPASYTSLGETESVEEESVEVWTEPSIMDVEIPIPTEAQANEAWGEPKPEDAIEDTSEPIPVTVSAQPEALDALPIDPDAEPLAWMEERVDDLRYEFSTLGHDLTVAAERMRSHGEFPSELLLGRVKEVRHLFERVVGKAREVSEEAGVPFNSDALSDLQALTSAVPSLRDQLEHRRAIQALQKGAVAQVERVLRLTSPSEPGFAPLATCLTQMRELRDRLESAPPEEWTEEAQSLVEGTHRVGALLGLVSADQATPDAKWAEFYDRVEAGFGTPLAVAVARLRIVESAS